MFQLHSHLNASTATQLYVIPQDMTDLAFLHEPGVLWNLKQRYSSSNIYTYTGGILIAVNPFQSLPQLYGRKVMDMYSSGDPAGLPPHVYAIASAAYKKMRQEGKGQAILVSLIHIIDAYFFPEVSALIAFHVDMLTSSEALSTV
eukprot:GHUV01017313.1.p1 GENE.GHUV01017313.1~~GHUV01017313.1.p1  ORF type:complete len:145 (+),score=39.38 GHUV01017313.1:161-595(+)